MSKKTKIVGMMLAVILCLRLCIPAYAVNETNKAGAVFSVALSQNTLSKSAEAQTVTMAITTDKALTVSTGNFNVKVPDGWSFSYTQPADCAKPTVNANTKYVAWMLSDDEAALTGTEKTDFGTITYTIPANAAGTFTLGIDTIYASVLDAVEGTDGGACPAYATATLTITDGSAAEGYAASVSSTNTTVAAGSAVAVSVNASHASDAKYTAAEMTLAYDKDKLTFVSVSDGTHTYTTESSNVKVADGVVTFEDCGQEKDLKDGIYTVNFTAASAAVGSAAVTLTSAKLSNKANAAASDLTLAAIADATRVVNFTITQTYNVTIGGTAAGYASGDPTVTSGSDYTLSVQDYKYYTYTVSATMVGSGTTTVTDNKSGTYTVKNVTGNLAFTVTRDAKKFNITFGTKEGTPVLTGVPENGEVTYGTNYTFNMPTLADYNVTIDSIKIGGTDVAYSIKEGVVTIQGSALTGDIAVVFAAAKGTVTISVEGGAASDVGTEYVRTAEALTEYVLSLANRDTLYKYTVTAKMNGNAVTVTEVEGNYKVAAADVKKGNLVFTVEKELDIAVYVNKYIALDGTNMWLVKVPMQAELSGRDLTYDSSNMFWVKGYGDDNSAGCYCYLVISNSKPDYSKDLSKFGVAETAAEAISGCDVNMTTVIDANDAQLIYNMYNTEYSGFSDDITVQKFLLADTNSDGTVDTQDVAKVISEILK